MRITVRFFFIIIKIISDDIPKINKVLFIFDKTIIKIFEIN